MIQSASDLMQKLSFPEAAQKVLLSALEALDCAEFRCVLAQYDETEHCDYPQMLEQVHSLCQSRGIGEYCGNMALFLSLAPRLRERYAQRGIPEEIFYDSLADLRYKLEECRLVKGQIGTFVPNWYTGFFNLTRFALGRLQFELKSLKKDCVLEGIPFSADSAAINIHIPRTGTRLDHALVLDAYARAAEFFRSAFPDGNILFTCHSWMLYPWIETVLAPGSNMAAFFRDFTIIDAGDHPDYRDAWRLFDCPYAGDPDKLPADSSLRRAFIRRIREGKPLGWGRGAFLYKQGGKL